MSKHEKRKEALFLFIESVLEPDHVLRQIAHEQNCFYELLEWREEILEHLNKRFKQEFE